MPDREDITLKLLGEQLELTAKRMPNGELRQRVRFDDGLAVSITKAAENGWQDAHHHEGLVEYYFVLEGWMFLVLHEDVDDAEYQTQWIPGGEMVEIALQTPHNVFLEEGTKILTFLLGEPVGNPERKGNDWWPDEDVDEWSKSFDPSRCS